MLDSIVKTLGEGEEGWHRLLAYTMLVSGVSAFIQLQLLPAPYGRYSKPQGWGPLINARFAWVWMESPNLYVSAACWLWGRDECRSSLANRVLLLMFVGHYTNRSLIYPLQMRGGRPMPLSIMLMAQAFCTANGYLQARHLTAFHRYDESWLTDWRFVLGCACFLLGLALNVHSDAILRNLRRPGETGYKIPRGGLFEYVSGANYAAEILEWGGFALAGWSLPAFTFAAFTALNIGPRALAHHQWYLQKLDGYPRDRKALIPFLL